MSESAMPQRQTYPIGIPRETLLPANEDNFDAGRSPVRSDPTSMAPRTSEYRGK